MTTYAKRPPHSARLGQTAHKRQSIATAPAVAAVVVNDRLIGTTFTPSGAMVLARPCSLEEQASGSSGEELASQAPINSKAGVASGSVCIGASSMSGVGHTAAPVPQRSSSTESYILNPNRKRLSAFSGFNLKDFNWPVLGGLLFLAAPFIVFGIIWAVSVFGSPR